MGRSGWTSSLVLGIGLFLVYSANGREIGTGDTVPAMYLPVAIVRGDGPFLDRWDRSLHAPGSPLPYYATVARGYIVSRYPLGPALLAVPFELPQIGVLDRLDPGWDADRDQARHCCAMMAKNAAAVIAALVGVALLPLLWGLGLGRLAWLAVLAAALGSDLWIMTSQSLWQHGPAALALTLSMVLLLPESAGVPPGFGSAGVPPAPTPGKNGCDPRAPRPARHRHATLLQLCLAGLTTTALVGCRPVDLLFAAVIVLWLAWHRPRDLVWFLPVPLLGAAALLGYNVS